MRLTGQSEPGPVGSFTGWACERVSEGSDGSLDTKNPDEFNMVYLSVHVCVIENVCMSVCL